MVDEKETWGQSCKRKIEKIKKKKKRENRTEFCCLISQREWIKNEKIRLQPSSENGRDTILYNSSIEEEEKKKQIGSREFFAFRKEILAMPDAINMCVTLYTCKKTLIVGVSLYIHILFLFSHID